MKDNRFMLKAAISFIMAILIAFSVLPSMAYSNENADTAEEPAPDIPFSFQYEKGDLLFSELEDAVLDPSEVPFVIGLPLATERDHVKRLYYQEPDDCTVLFQNRNGSKTIYYFSKPVKQSGRDLNSDEISSRVMNSESSVTISANRITLPANSILPMRLTQESSTRLYFYNIGYADVFEWSPDSRDMSFIDITKSVRDWSVSSEGEPSFDMISKSGDPVLLSGGGLIVMSINYSDLAGDWTVKTVPESSGVSAKYLKNSYPAGTNSISLTGSQTVPMTRWLIIYEYNRYMLRSQSNQLKYLTGDALNGNVYLQDYYDDPADVWDMERWDISIASLDDGMITLKNEYSLDSYLCHSGTWIHLKKSSYIENDEHIWQLVNKNNNYTEFQYFNITEENVIIKTGDFYYIACSVYPSVATYQLFDMILPYPAEEGEELEFFSNTPVSGTVTVRYTYCPTKTCSFHVDIVDYPNSESSFIQSGKAYELFAVDDANHRSLHYSSGALSFTAYPQNSNANSFIFTYVSNGRYRINPESDNTKYLAYSNGGLTLSSYSSNSNQLWYPVMLNGSLYLANGLSHSKVISYSVNGSSITPGVSNNIDCNSFALPLAVPLYMQGTSNTCGPCNMRMDLSYLGYSYSESYIKTAIVNRWYDPNNQGNHTEEDYYSAVWCLTWFANTYSQISHSYHSLSSLGISDLQELLWDNYSLARPCICHVKTDNNGFSTYSILGYPTKGHYLNVKGLFSTDDITYVIINDCHYNFCGEKSIPISDFHHLIMNGHQFYIGAIAP